MLSTSGPIFNTNAAGNAHISNVNGNIINGNVYMLSTYEEDKIYRWLDAPDSSGNFHAAREKHHEQTGTWFIEGKDYIRWKEAPDSALWVYGTPGCGKTVICSTVIEKIREECAAEPTFACAYFFFDSRNGQTELSLHDKFIRSIIKQLSHQSTGFPTPLVELYDGGQQQPSLASLQLTLQTIARGFERTYIIVDALDECIDREKVMAWIAQLIQCKAGNIHVLVSSRQEIDIEEQFDALPALARTSLAGARADADIKLFIDAMLSKMTKWDVQTIARVREALIAGADGMFRWVALQIAELSKCRSRKAVEDQLQTLPKDLDGMYERALLRSPSRLDLKQFLLWLAFSTRPLMLEELADVVTVDLSADGTPSYDANRRYFAATDMLVTCSSFVTEVEITSFGNRGYISPVRGVKLAHMSVKDYLVSDRLKTGPASYFSISAMIAHSLITKTCLAYLFHLGSFPSSNQSFLEECFPLGHYAAKYWISHMRLGGDEDAHVSQMIGCIFSLDGNALAHWVRLDDPEEPGTCPIKSPDFQTPAAEIASPLYYALICGLNTTAQQLLINGADVNVQEGFYGNALQAASLKGDDVITRLLLERGAVVNAQGGYYGNALQVASAGGHTGITQLLLEHGADVNAQGGEEGNALQAASSNGCNEITRLLLEHGAYVNAQGGFYGNALQAASSEGHYKTVQLLLENGADVNVEGGCYGKALQAALLTGHDEITRLLLEHGADVNAQGRDKGSALQFASAMGHTELVRLLLKHGADVNAQAAGDSDALQVASAGGYVEIAQLLLERGADVNAHGGKYGNSMQAASVGGHTEIVWLLLEHEADVNTQVEYYINALQTASLRGYSALEAASLRGNELIMRILIEHGALDAWSARSEDEHRYNDSRVESEADHALGVEDDSGEEWASAEEDPDDSTAG